MDGYYRPERWTVRVLPGRFGLGAVAAPGVAPCGANSTRNPKTGVCYCNLGFEEGPGADCVPINPTKPCLWAGQQRNPIDKGCECPPGHRPDPSPTGTSCIPIRYFPNCKDANGQKVPNCLFGYPLKETAIAVGGGAVLGLILGTLLSR
jgi:hypothetical protein